MRFKTRVRVDKVPALLRIAQTLDRLERRCVLHLTSSEDDGVLLVIQPDISRGVAAYATLNKKTWFENYRIESQNSNQIGLELDIQNLLKALRSAAAADEVVVKLAKKGVPVLTFEINTSMGPILQDVPVIVLSPMGLAECHEPEFKSVVGFTLPALGKIYSLVDRLKGVGVMVEISATIGEKAARMSLKVVTDAVSVATTYKDLARAQMTDRDVLPESDKEQTVQATVDLRHLSKAFYSHQTAPKHALCFLSKHCVLIHLMAGDANISYFIPTQLAG